MSRALPLDPPVRILLGPGPSDVPPSVLRALAAPTIGHLDPAFLRIADDVRLMLRAIMKTENELTLPVSGTGSAGMEACFANIVEPGTRVLVGSNGVFGGRMAEVASRCGADVTVAEGEWGRALGEDLLRATAGGRRFDVVAVVHAETSTGVLQDLAPVRRVADELGALLLVDAVTSLAGVNLEVDAWGIDVLYSGTQKCLSCPPGLSPVTFSERATERIRRRGSRVQSWYLDLTLVMKYWGAERVYHHTAPINMLYALHEACRLVLAEGVDARTARHMNNGRALVAGLEALGLAPRVPTDERLPQLTTVAIPDGVADVETRRALLERYGIEIGGGLGKMAGNTWRFGLMGASSTRRNVITCLAALEALLREQGHSPSGDPVAAAEAAWAAS
jgi:alanine-glyoxylate transaminase/serine-glyoxylate transaminase/serine-pyruvate transaminase